MRHKSNNQRSRTVATCVWWGPKGRSESNAPGRACRAILIALIATSLQLCAGGTWARAQNVSYSYDKLGRLVTVEDPSGNTAAYNYDAVGNLTSITNSTSSTVTVTGFTPASGSASLHTPVTIQGSNFSTTPSLNSVTFNGASAVVTGSTSTTIVTSVPGLATTGPIAVTAPSGTGISGSAFSVTP